jgi:hypothetical protein
VTEPTHTPKHALIEDKVKASTAATFAASLIYALANAYSTTRGVLDPLPQWAQFPLLVALPVVATFCAGYMTPSNRI